MRIRSTLMLLFTFTISSMFFLPNFLHGHPHDDEVEELKEIVKQQNETIKELKEQVQTNTGNIQQNADDIKKEQDDRKEEDKQDVEDAYNDLTDETIGAIPGSETVLIPKKAAEAVLAEKEYQDKYGETVSGESLSESGSCSGSCQSYQPDTPRWCTMCRCMHSGMCPAF